MLRQFDLGVDGVIMHGATPTELAPVVDAYRALRPSAASTASTRTPVAEHPALPARGVAPLTFFDQRIIFRWSKFCTLPTGHSCRRHRRERRSRRGHAGASSTLAAELFIERGYSAVSMRDIASAAKLTKGAVYGHFRSKGQLLVEVIRWKLAERDHSPGFSEATRRPGEAASRSMYDEPGRDVRLLEVDAAAAARHDTDVAAGLVELYRERHERIRDAMSATCAIPTPRRGSSPRSPEGSG